ncbi:MAG: acyl-CoA dehydrogenase family protein [Rhodospirillales bacterium]
MDFSDTAEEAAFRAEARAFLDANAARKAASARGYRSRALDAQAIGESRLWQARKAACGFTGIHWPRRYGGRDGTPDAGHHLRAGRSPLRCAR